MAADSSQTSNGTVGKFSFYSGQQGYQSLAKSFTDLAHSRDRFGSSTGVNAFGSTQDLSLDSMRRMSMQEDARSHRISAEVMKQRLYESVITSPRRRRQSISRIGNGDHQDEIQLFARGARMAQSLPVTPAVTPGTSQNTSPLHSPTSSRKFSYQQYQHYGHRDRYTLGDGGFSHKHYSNPRGYGLQTLFKPRQRSSTIHQRTTVSEDRGEQPMDGVECNHMTFSTPSSQQLYQRYQQRSQMNPAGVGDGVFLAPVGKAPRTASPAHHQTSQITSDVNTTPSLSQVPPMQNDIEMETDEPPGDNMQNCYRKRDPIPTEQVVEEQNGRLTTKHIKTLSFLQEMHNDNKYLKNRVEDLELELSQCEELHDLAKSTRAKLAALQEEHLTNIDLKHEELIKKHKQELMQKVQEKLEDEKVWSSEKDQLNLQIQKQQEDVSTLQIQLQNAEKFKYENELLLSKIQQLEKEISNKADGNDNLEISNQTLLVELEKLEQVQRQNGDLKDEVNVVNQKNKELQYKIERLERELSEIGFKEQDSLMQTLKSKLTKLHKERAVLKEQLTDKETESTNLKDENEQLRRALRDSEHMRQQLYESKQEVDQEVLTLRRQLELLQGGPKDNFRDFVHLKRQLNVTKEENDDLKVRLKYKTKSGPLPSLKEPRVPSAQHGQHVKMTSGRRKSSIDLNLHN